MSCVVRFNTDPNLLDYIFIPSDTNTKFQQDFITLSFAPANFMQSWDGLNSRIRYRLTAMMTYSAIDPLALTTLPQLMPASTPLSLPVLSPSA